MSDFYNILNYITYQILLNFIFRLLFSIIFSLLNFFYPKYTIYLNVYEKNLFHWVFLK